VFSHGFLKQKNYFLAFLDDDVEELLRTKIINSIESLYKRNCSEFELYWDDVEAKALPDESPIQ